MDDYETPRWLLDIAFPAGYFDPCPLYGAKNGPDGLAIDWPVDQPVFINPPYSRPAPWLLRASQHKGPVALLLMVAPDSEWWQRYNRFFKVTLLGDDMKFLKAVDGKQRRLTNEDVAYRGHVRFNATPGTIRLYVSWWWRLGR